MNDQYHRIDASIALYGQPQILNLHVEVVFWNHSSWLSSMHGNSCACFEKWPTCFQSIYGCVTKNAIENIRQHLAHTKNHKILPISHIDIMGLTKLEFANLGL